MTSTSKHTMQMIDEGEPKDTEQVLPPWNTESYNCDLPDLTKEEYDELEKPTYPKIYGFKTPERHSFRFVDGQPESSS